VWALRRRGHNRIDRWNGTYRRALWVGSRAVTVEVTPVGPPDRPELHVTSLTAHAPTPSESRSITRQISGLLGVDADLTPFYEIADADPRLAPLKDRFLGLRPPQFPSLFESLVNAIANQQLSLEVGIELLNRFCERFGPAPADTYDMVAFPEPEHVLGATTSDIRALGFSVRKAEYLLACADEVATGTLSSSLEGSTRQHVAGQLTAIRGIGRWSAEYVLLRGLGDHGVFPADDVGARNKLQRFMSLDAPPNRDAILSILSAWNPYAGLIYFHLLLDGLHERGLLDT
jgi:DNA-3-methyladenine glycosylase II